MKKILALLVSVLLVCSLSLCAFAAPDFYVHDSANVLDTSTESEIENMLVDVADEKGVDFYVLTKNDGTNTDTKEYMANFISTNSLDKSGVPGAVFLIDLDSNYYEMMTYAKGEEYFTSSVSSKIYDAYYYADTYYEALANIVSVIEINVEKAEVVYDENYDYSAPESNGAYLTDDADLFTPEEEAKLLAKVEKIMATYGIDFVLHTTNDIGNKSVQDYADDYFDYNGYSDNGLLFMLNMEGRDYYTSTEGIAIDVLTDASRGYIESLIIDDLSAGNYYTAFDKYVTEIENCFAANKSGEEYPPTTLTDILMKEAVVIGVAVLIAFVVGSSLKKKMNNAVKKTEANQYVVPGTLNITGGNDMFIHKTVSSVKEAKSSETHRSSSGDTHGGGGGKF